MSRNKSTKLPILLGVVALGAVIIYIILNVTPSNNYHIVGLSLAIAVLGYLLSTLFPIKRITRILLFIYILLFLLSSAFAGFNLLNIILLTSFIIGIKLLFSR